MLVATNLLASPSNSTQFRWLQSADIIKYTEGLYDHIASLYVPKLWEAKPPERLPLSVCAFNMEQEEDFNNLYFDWNPVGMRS